MSATVGNWGRWGPDDQRGAANLVDGAKVLSALSVPMRGKVYPLGQPVQRAGVPMGGHGGPTHHMFVSEAAQWPGGDDDGAPCIVEDYLGLRIHGQATHMDALGHVWREGHLYNGFSDRAVRTEGLERCGIEQAGAIVTRGVLLDLARARRVPHLPGGEIVEGSELAGCCEASGVELQPGDAVLLRTGWRQVHASDPEEYLRHRPGIGLDAAGWLAARDVTVVGADTLGVETRPFPAGTLAPVHQLLLRDHGIYLVEMLDLDQLAADSVTTFLFVLAPLRLVGGSGSPVNPLAIT